MRNTVRNELNKTLIVCVDSYADGVPKGRFYGAGCEGVKKFDSLMQLLVALDEGLDEANFPQSYLKMRRFTPKKNGITGEEIEKIGEGKLATFSVKILFRQNASWQGCMFWFEGNVEESFRSALEFVFLMNSALESKKEIR